MALKIVMLRHKLDKMKAELEAVKRAAEGFELREKELETAIGEAETEEQERAVEEQVETLESERTANEQQRTELETKISEAEAEIRSLEEKQQPPAREPEKAERNDFKMNHVQIRSLPMGQRALDALSYEQRKSMVESKEAVEFFTRLRQMKGEQRAVSGAELSIPVVFLELISENMYRYSKLLRRVRVRNVDGETRQTIAGTVPEAVWTEMCGAINELSFGFNQVTLDGYKVAGFVPVCNSILEDNDINLAGWIVEMLSEAIGLAMDKAILYGKGSANKMPLGIVTRLAQTQKPADYPAKAPEWVDLHTSNIVKIDGATAAGADFWAKLMAATGNTYTEYSRGEQFWAMNSKTYAALKSKLITFTATGDIVANLFGTLPIVGGDVDVLEFIPDGDIIGGYGDLYLLAMRSGMSIEASREVQFIQDNTVFRGKQRADGVPVIPGAFVAININNKSVTTVMDFAADNANDAKLTALKIGNESLSPSFNADKYTYTIASAANASDKVEVTTAQADAEVAIEYNGANVRNGGTVTWVTGSKPTPMHITVKQGNAVRVYTVTVTKS